MVGTCTASCAVDRGVCTWPCLPAGPMWTACCSLWAMQGWTRRGAASPPACLQWSVVLGEMPASLLLPCCLVAVSSSCREGATMPALFWTALSSGHSSHSAGDLAVWQNSLFLAANFTAVPPTGQHTLCAGALQKPAVACAFPAGGEPDTWCLRLSGYTCCLHLCVLQPSPVCAAGSPACQACAAPPAARLQPRLPWPPAWPLWRLSWQGCSRRRLPLTPVWPLLALAVHGRPALSRPCAQGGAARWTFKVGALPVQVLAGVSWRCALSHHSAARLRCPPRIAYMSVCIAESLGATI